MPVSRTEGRRTTFRFRRRRRWWPLLGLLVVVAFLTHDLVMTAHAMGHAAHAESGGHHAVATTSPPSACDCAVVTSPEECDTVRPAVSAQERGRASSVKATATAPTPLIDPFDSVRLDSLGALHVRSPSSRRALLQVYRI